MSSLENLEIGKLSLEADKGSQVLQTFFQPLKLEILSINQQKPNNVPLIPLELFQNLCQFIWDPNIIHVKKGLLQKCYNQLDSNFQMTPKQSDLSDYLDYKPSEIMAFKASQVFIALILPNPKLFKEELEKFKELMQDIRIARDGRAEEAYRFLYQVFSTFYRVLADDISEEEINIQNFKELSLPSKCIIHGLSVTFIKLFRVKMLERTQRMQRLVLEDESNMDWTLTLAEILRLKRRDKSSRCKWATQEELALLEQCLSQAPENPFVRLSVLDTIIGSVRDFSGRFICGDIRLENLDESMQYLLEQCRQLAKDFPKNVMIHSIISDYFARYFPHRFFDVDRALELLRIANKLNPNNPKTTHRFGILWRMSYGNCEESLTWLAKTIELDPTHYPATIEYFKTLFGKFEDYDIPVMMKTVLESSVSEGWSERDRAEFMFYLGLAHYGGKDTEKTLDCWQLCGNACEALFQLEDVLVSYDHFNWDTKRFNIDAIKLWIRDEVKKNGPRKEFIQHIFSLMLGITKPIKPRNVDSLPNIFPYELYRLLPFDP